MLPTIPTLNTPRYQLKLHRKGSTYATTLELPQDILEDKAREALDAFVRIFKGSAALESTQAVSLYHFPSDTTIDSIKIGG